MASAMVTLPVIEEIDLYLIKNGPPNKQMQYMNNIHTVHFVVKTIR